MKPGTAKLVEGSAKHRREESVSRRGFVEKAIRQAIRESERTARRRQRELQKEAQRTAMLQQARHQVEVFENQIELLVSIHRQATPTVNWRSLAEVPRPQPREVDPSRLRACQAALANFQLNFLERLLGLQGRRRRLERDIEEAHRWYQEESLRVGQEHREVVADWEVQTAFARDMLAGKTSSYEEAILDSGCFEELAEYGSTPRVRWASSQVAHVELRSSGANVVPLEEKTLTARGKLSVKKMNAARRMEIYQDYLCGIALRAARELLAVTPLRGALVDVRGDWLNTATGHIENATFVSVFCERSAMERINFAQADASAVVSSFDHVMKLTRGKDLSPVEPLNIESYLAP